MWNSRKVVAAILLLLFLFTTAPSTAEIISLNIRSDKRSTILFSKFQFSNTGYVSVAVSSVNLTSNSSQPDPSRIGFFLLPAKLAYQFERNPFSCLFDNKSMPVFFAFSDLSPVPHSSFTKSYNVTYPGGSYSLYFANCNELSLVTMDVHAELYSIDDDGVTKNYKSAMEPPPSFFLSFFFIYLCLQGVWIYESIKNRHCIQLIHIPMSVLFIMNLVYFICGFAHQQDVMVTGTHHGWFILFYISRFMRDVNLLSVIMLIGVGWCNWRRDLPESVKAHFPIVILLQVGVHGCTMAIGETGPYNEHWIGLISGIWVLNLISCLFVSIHVYCSYTSFKEATDTSIFVRTYKSLEGANTVRHDVFPALVLPYLFMMVPVIMMQDIVSQEFFTLLFSMAMFYMYRPFVIDDQDQKHVGFLV